MPTFKKNKQRSFFKSNGIVKIKNGRLVGALEKKAKKPAVETRKTPKNEE